MIKIDKVKIKNFKSLRDIDMSLSNLTLLTGVNSSGKSSFIQALLLLKQNEDNFYTRIPKSLIINGQYTKLGNKKDILFQDTYQENIEIGISSEKTWTTIKFNNQDLKIDFNTDCNSSIDGAEDYNIFCLYSLFSDAFQYIQTDRIIPNITYQLSDEVIEQNQIGFKGEYSAHYLAENGRKELNIEALKYTSETINAKTMQLLENVSLWLGEISKGIGRKDITRGKNLDNLR